MQAMVPQFIDVEDKITPFLTLKQFIFLVVGGAISAMLYPFIETTPWMVISAVIMGLSGAFGFVKINGRPFGVMVYAALKYAWNPHFYMYQKVAILQKKETNVHATEEKGGGGDRISSERLEQIARLLDARGR